LGVWEGKYVGNKREDGRPKTEGVWSPMVRLRSPQLSDDRWPMLEDGRPKTEGVCWAVRLSTPLTTGVGWQKTDEF